MNRSIAKWQPNTVFQLIDRLSQLTRWIKRRAFGGKCVLRKGTNFSEKCSHFWAKWIWWMQSDQAIGLGEQDDTRSKIKMQIEIGMEIKMQTSNRYSRFELFTELPSEAAQTLRTRSKLWTINRETTFEHIFAESLTSLDVANCPTGCSMSWLNGKDHKRWSEQFKIGSCMVT